MRQSFLHAVDRVNAVLMPALVAAFVFVSCVTFAQVVARYVFRSPLVWSEEVVRYGIIWMVFLGSGLAVRRGAMIAVEILFFALPGAYGRALRIVALVVSAVAWVMLVWLSIRIQDDLEGIRMGVMELPVRYLYLALPIGCSWAFVNTMAALLDRSTAPKGQAS